jgi:hypothetical protein
MAFLQINAGESATVQVAVRIRPTNKREINNENIIMVKGSATQSSDNPFVSAQSHAISAPVVATELQIKNPETKEKKTFSFDYIYGQESTQEQVFNQIGMSIIDNTFKGYNTCVFAYGQTGTGKSHSMMGSGEQPGLIPRTCGSLFDLQADHNTASAPITIGYKVEIAYLEIYAESVRDLLSKTPKAALKVREHPVIGPYVEKLTQILVEDFESIRKLIDQGNKERATASTAMNNQSSRSHAILTIYFTQIITDPSIGKPRQVVSKINLVDLAGSERVESSEVEGINFTEAININKSLTTLGNVISKLAAQSKDKIVKKPKKSGIVKKPVKKSILKKPTHIPYRDSTLTWILRESLGGNSKTYMIATLSPSSINYNESISTLRYASNVKQIINTVKVNEDPNDKLIRALKAEIAELKMQVSLRRSDANFNGDDLSMLSEEIKQREALMQERDKSWEQKLSDSKALEERIRAQHAFELEQTQLQHQNEKLELEREYERKLAAVAANQATQANQAEYTQPQQIIDPNPAILSLTTELISKQEDNNNVLRELKQAIIDVKNNNNSDETIRQYESKIERITIEHETIKSAHDSAIKEIAQLKANNATLKTELSTVQRELQTQLKRFDEERTSQSKQIQQLKHKNHLLESAAAQTTNRELHLTCSALDERIAKASSDLADIEKKYKDKTADMENIKIAYDELTQRIDADKEEYAKLHTMVSDMKNDLIAQIESARVELSNPTTEQLMKINEGFTAILNKLNK